MGGCAPEVAALWALCRPWGWPSVYFRQVTSGVDQKLEGRGGTCHSSVSMGEGGDPKKGWVVKVNRERCGGGGGHGVI